MGREIRMVPPNWEHPENQPMYDRNYEDACAEWKQAYAKWEAGERPDYWTKGEDPEEFWDWEGMPPDKNYHRPWKDEEASWYQLWETVTEGTPVSPPFATKDELAQYLAANGDFWDQKRGRGGWGIERARAFVDAGWAPSFMAQATNGKIDIFDSKDIPLATKNHAD